MKLNTAIIIISTLFSSSSVFVSAQKKGGGSSGGGSSYSGGSSSSNYQPGPSPTTAVTPYTPTLPSSTTNNSPTTSTNTNGQPSSNTNTAPSSGGGQYGPTYSKDTSYSNPNPAYKPKTSAGAPTMASGGGGYNYNTPPPRRYGASSLFFSMASGYLFASFLYGGMYSSPSCRGGYDYSGYCNYGTSSANHQCPQQIPLCPIPQSIRDSWYIGSTTNVEVIADKSTCSSSSPNLGPDTPNTLSPTPTPPATIDVENKTAEEILEMAEDYIPTLGFTLADCTDAIATSGTCTSSRFTYDELSGKCKCCDAGADLTPWEYSSAVYVYSSSNPLENYGAPTYCISGSTMHFPKKSTTVTTSSPDPAVSGGGAFVDEQYSCLCGECKECGNPKVSYLDWNGPFVVPDEVGMTTTSSVSDKPLYDPVDTCECNVGGPQCSEQYMASAADSNKASSAWLIIVILTLVSSSLLTAVPFL